MIKKVENNKSAFYYKINGFLFGSFKNYRYLCISERSYIIQPYATRLSEQYDNI